MKFIITSSFFFLFFIFLFLISIPYSIDLKESLNENMTMGMSFPPLTNSLLETFTLINMKNLNISFIRFAEDWSLREPSKGNYNWIPMKNRLDFFRKNNFKVFLTFQSKGPIWATNLRNDYSATFKNNSEFEEFLHKWFLTFSSYSDVIYKVQFGNEWMSKYWFIGSEEQFSTYSNIFYNISKFYWPNTPVVLGGFSIGALRALSAFFNFTNYFRDDNGIVYEGEKLNSFRSSDEVHEVIKRTEYVISNTSYDIIDLHLYHDYSNFGIYIHMINNLTNKFGKSTFPIICTEFGGPNSNWESFLNFLSWNYHANIIHSILRTISQLNISEAYFFQLVSYFGASNEHSNSVLLNNFLIIKPTYYIIQYMKNSKISYFFIYYLIYSGFLTILLFIILIIIELFKKNIIVESSFEN